MLFVIRKNKLFFLKKVGISRIRLKLNRSRQYLFIKQKMKKILLLVVLASAFAFSSCSKDKKDKEPKPFTEAIIGKWNAYSAEKDGKVEIFKPEEGCTTVAYYEFLSDKKYKYVEMKSECYENVRGMGTYSIKGTTLTLTDKNPKKEGIVYNIVSITDDTLVLSYKDDEGKITKLNLKKA